jgi:hypothetical protein
MEVVLERRFSRGLQARVGYTYSKLHNNGAENSQPTSGDNATIQNPLDTLEWGLSADDTPHVLLTGFTWEIPGSQKWTSGPTKLLLAGWNVSGVLRYESGRPLNIVMANDLAGFLFNGQKRPNRVGSVEGVAPRDGNFDPNNQNYFNRDAWTDPGPLQFGNAPRRDGTARSFPVYSEDLNIFKDFLLNAPSKLRFEAQFGNIFNRTLFCDPNTNWSQPSFGVISTSATSRGRFSSRYDMTFETRMCANSRGLRG